MRVDAHFHVWDLESHRYPWLQDGEPIVRIYGNSKPLRQSYRLEQYVADAAVAGIEAGVYVQCGMQDPVDEAIYIQSLVDQKHGNGMPIMIVGHADMAAEGAAPLLERFAEIPNVRGIRYSIAWDENPAFTFAAHPPPLASDSFLRSFVRLGELGLRLDCMLYSAQMEALAALCERYPETQVILNHTGLPFEAADPGLKRWREGMSRLSTLPQICVKISGLGMVRHDWTADGQLWARQIINETIDTFGIDRCMFASNFPVERLAASFGAVYGIYEEAVATRTDTDRQKLFGTNALRLYGF